MARPLGSKNKTPQELKLEAEIKKRTAQNKIDKLKLDQLREKRTPPRPPSGKEK